MIAIRSFLPVLVGLALGAWSLGTPPALTGQAPASLPVSLANGDSTTLPVASHRGYPALSAAALSPLGWSLISTAEDSEVALRHDTGLELRFTAGSPYLRWDGTLLQMAHPSYWVADDFHVPIQLAVDLLPGLLPSVYRFDPIGYRVEVGGEREGAAPPGVAAVPPPEADLDLPASGAPPADPLAAPGEARVPGASERQPRVVIIDPGHGGSDSGAIGPRGIREKDVALAIALALWRELSSDPDLEVRLTRSQDEEVPLWTRGEWATEWKGDRPGLFISIHANALADRPGVRGFETYFLSEARDEHERRVSALENAPLREAPAETGLAGADPFLDLILRDLRAFDHQHWSALFAEEVQRELSRSHPGPDRGVKQGPFAVITNALMPSVLVEVGFLTNPEEERLLVRPDFHRDTARALARAVEAFFERYPPGGLP